jgi:glycosyltransferase involved in cell wall biosynthesis
MNILAITIGSYPSGEATTNRNISILKGLLEWKNNVELLVLSPTNKLLAGQRLKKGIIDGVTFEYTSRTIAWPKNTLRKIFIMLDSIINALRIISNKHRSVKIDAIILLMSEPFLMHPFIVYANRNKINIYHEQTETPEIVFNNESIIAKLHLSYYKSLIKKLTGIYVISSYLKNYFASFIAEYKICIINMTVDHTRFLENLPSPFNFKYIAYCGTMYGNKDGLSDLITAYEIVRKKVDLKLVLIGDIKDERSKYVLDLINNLRLNDNVILTGSVNSANIPQYLMNAEILVLSRPDNIQAKAGFPTKLGEYLLTQKPTILTEVGDIPKFLQDGVSSFIVKPDNPVLFAEKIIYVYENYEKALIVAKNGKTVAINNFNYIDETKKLVGFFEKFAHEIN